MSVSPEEAGDRLAIRELIDTYAHCADRRLPEQQADLYVERGCTLVYQGADSEPVQVLRTRDEHLAGFRTLSRYVMTTHFNGQSTITLDGDRATGETYCLAHHVLEDEHGCSLIVMAIRYEDAFAKQDGVWRFARRNLVIDWSDTRPLQP